MSAGGLASAFLSLSRPRMRTARGCGAHMTSELTVPGSAARTRVHTVQIPNVVSPAQAPANQHIAGSIAPHIISHHHHRLVDLRLRSVSPRFMAAASQQPCAAAPCLISRQPTAKNRPCQTKRRRLRLRPTSVCDKVPHDSLLHAHTKVSIPDDNWSGTTRLMLASSTKSSCACHCVCFASWPTASTQSKSKMSEGRAAELTRWIFFLVPEPTRRADDALGVRADWELDGGRAAPPLEVVGSDALS